LFWFLEYILKEKEQRFMKFDKKLLGKTEEFALGRELGDEGK
jgi:hypothetical protein